MTAADPNLIRQAVAQFQPRRRPRFGNLQPCREVIMELREKGASCEAVAELLTRYGVKTSRTMVNEFVRTHCQPKNARRKKLGLSPTPTVALPPLPLPAVSSPVTPATSPPDASTKVKKRGPHIAKVELLPPGETI